MARVELAIGGKSYLDFKSARIRYSIEELARTFEFEFTDKWFNTLTQAIPFVEGDEVEVLVHGKTAFKGYLEVIDIDYSATDRSISVSGRSKICDLIDCSAQHKTGSWKNAKLKDIAEALVKPYGLKVKVDPWALSSTLEPFKRWAIEDEETVHGCIGRAARMRGLFLMGDEEGNLIITKTSPLIFAYPLVYGQNIEEARMSTEYRERFSEYTIKSQRAGDDTLFAENVGKGFYKTKDPQVTRHRPLIIMSDGQGSAKELTTRGDWERNYRAGKSRRLTYQHVGFKTPLGLFPINQLIPVNDPVIDFTGNLLIASVTYTLGTNERTTIELAAPETFDVLLPPKKSGGPLW
jgi:prophage tail gpP-like protein